MNLNLFEKLRDGATSVISWFTGEVHNIWVAVGPTVKSDFAKFVQAFEGVALNAVVGVAKAELSNDDKRNQAVAVVLDAAKAQAWDVTETAALTLVQDTYAAYKASQGPLVTPPPTS